MVVRDCHIRIDREGNWFYNNSPITNKSVWLYFSRHITKDEQGQYLLQTKNQVLPLEVEDTLFVIKHCSIISSIPPKLNVLLNDKTEEIVAWESIWLQNEKDIYCLIKDGAFEARFNRDSQFELGDRLEFDQDSKRYYLIVQGEKFYLTHKVKKDLLR
jgi:hypothetical protein